MPPRYEIPDVRGEVRDVAIPASAMDLTSVQQLAQSAYDTATATQQSMPVPATAAPISEKTAATVGAAVKYAREDHAHPRLTSTTYAALAADGTATVTFTRAFVNKPGVVLTEVDASATQPLICVVQSFIGAQGNYTGCVIKGYRSQALPSQSQLSVSALLTGVITGVNAIASSLTGFNVLGGSAAGASVSCIAVARSDVA